MLPLTLRQALTKTGKTGKTKANECPTQVCFCLYLRTLNLCSALPPDPSICLSVARHPITPNGISQIMAPGAVYEETTNSDILAVTCRRSVHNITAQALTPAPHQRDCPSTLHLMVGILPTDNCCDTVLRRVNLWSGYPPHSLLHSSCLVQCCCAYCRLQ